MTIITRSKSNKMNKQKRNKVSNKVKTEIYSRQYNGNVCSNYPGSPLSVMIGMHCMSYNTFGHVNFGIVPKGILEVEHLLPHCEGGKNTPENLHLMCSSCHCLKSKMENMDRLDMDRDTLMENIPLMEDCDYEKITTNFRENFKNSMLLYIRKNENEGIKINYENLVKVINNLVI